MNLSRNIVPNTAQDFQGSGGSSREHLFFIFFTINNLWLEILISCMFVTGIEYDSSISASDPDELYLFNHFEDSFDTN
jgi:hypothetical protein